MSLCRGFLAALGWPNTIVFVYGESGTGKTTLLLEFAKELCALGRCMYITTTPGLHFLERASQLGVRIENMKIIEAFDYIDYIRILSIRDLPLYTFVGVDAVNEFLRTPSEEAVRATTLLTALLYKLNEDYGTTIAYTGVVSGEGEPTGYQLIKHWVKRMVKLTREKSFVKAEVKALQQTQGEAWVGEYYYEIGGEGLKWLKC